MSKSDKKYCIFCGADLPTVAGYCEKCGKQLISIEGVKEKKIPKEKPKKQISKKILISSITGFALIILIIFSVIHLRPFLLPIEEETEEEWVYTKYGFSFEYLPHIEWMEIRNCDYNSGQIKGTLSHEQNITYIWIGWTRLFEYNFIAYNSHKSLMDSILDFYLESLEYELYTVSDKEEKESYSWNDHDLYTIRFLASSYVYDYNGFIGFWECRTNDRFFRIQILTNNLEIDYVLNQLLYTFSCHGIEFKVETTSYSFQDELSFETYNGIKLTFNYPKNISWRTISETDEYGLIEGYSQDIPIIMRVDWSEREPLFRDVSVSLEYEINDYILWWILGFYGINIISEETGEISRQYGVDAWDYEKLSSNRVEIIFTKFIGKLPPDFSFSIEKPMSNYYCIVGGLYCPEFDKLIIFDIESPDKDLTYKVFNEFSNSFKCN